MPCRPAVSNFRGRPRRSGRRPVGRRRRGGRPARGRRRQRQRPAASPIRLKRRRARKRTKDHDKQRYRDHDMVLIEPSIGTMIGLPRRRLRSRAVARNVLDVTLASWKRWPKGPNRPSRFRALARGAPQAPLMRKPRKARRFRKPEDIRRVVATGSTPGAPALHDGHPVNAAGARNFDLVWRLAENFVSKSPATKTPMAMDAPINSRARYLFS
jgi:hypothetical protein